jgi:hypothetical protein
LWVKHNTNPEFKDLHIPEWEVILHQNRLGYRSILKVLCLTTYKDGCLVTLPEAVEIYNKTKQKGREGFEDFLNQIKNQARLKGIDI